ncbi:VOC family protein [soil metagenome]
MTVVLKLQHVSVPMPPGSHDIARGFYGDVLGMTEKQPPTALHDLNVVWFSAGDDVQEVHVFPDEGMNHNASGQHLCLQVDSLESFRAQMSSHGVSIEETTPIRNRPRCFVRDPFGNLIEIAEILGDFD